MSTQQQETKGCGVSAMLRNPGEVVQRICEGSPRQCAADMARMAFAAALGFGLFGFVAGLFVGWQVALWDAAKAVGIVAFSFCICLPMLHVFSNLAGCALSFWRICGMGLLCLATLGCIFAALAPILWLFAVSTESAGSMALIFVVMAAGAWCFVRVPIDGICKKGAIPNRRVLCAWAVVLFVVALQMVTVMRPMLSSPEEGRLPPAKCFFLKHFSQLWLSGQDLGDS